jgi:two-component sensor histidine kinase
LIINELVTNVLKHAFRGRASGVMRITAQTSVDHCVTLTVSDNGEGFPPEVDFQSPKTLGLQLVAMLVYKLRGQITLDRQSGAHVIITFTNVKRRDER